MSAERTPRDDEPFLAAPLAWLAAAAAAQPLWTLGLGLLLAIASIGYAGVRLTLRTGRGDLIRPDAEYHRRWVAFCEEFSHQDDVLVLVEGSDPREIAAASDEIAEQLAAKPELFHAVLHRFDSRPLRTKGLHYVAPEDLGGIALWAGRYAPLASRDFSGLRLEQQIAALSEKIDGRTEVRPTSDMRLSLMAAAELTRLATSATHMLRTRGEYRSPWPALPGAAAQAALPASEHFLIPMHGGKQVGVVALRLAIDDKPRFVSGGQAISELRRILGKVRSRHPRLQLGLTGLPVLEFDEMEASQRDMLLATLVSLAGVAILFAAGFGGIRQPLLCLAALAFALVWSCGYITLAVGHLNILSMAFAVMLIGLGIDFGIHLAIAFAAQRGRGMSIAEAIDAATRQVGPGIVTGGVTTAAAFFAMSFTDFLGLGELGIIAGGGILLCLLTTFTILPALLALFETTPLLASGAANATVPQSAPLTLPLDRWLAPLHRGSLVTLVLMIGGVVAAGWALPRLWYDHNLLHLQSPSIESVAWEEKLLRETELSVWHAVSVATTRDELLARKAAFAKLPTVARVEEIGSLIPADDPARGPLIAQIRSRLERLPAKPLELAVPQSEALAKQAEQAAKGIAELRAKSPRNPADPMLLAAQQALDGLSGQLISTAPAESLQLLAAHQRAFAADVLARLHALRAASDPTPPTWNDLPPGMVTRFVGSSGQFALRIYSRGKAWDMPLLERFVADVQSVDPNVTGQPLETFYASRQMQESYLQAGIYALVAVLLLVILDFGSTRSAFWAMGPVGLGLVQTLGIMAWLGIPLNPANMIVLPLVIGTGIDYGVHIIHDYRRRVPGPYRVSRATSLAVLLSGLTTVVGFGSLMLADHQGLASLGRVLTIGITSCMLHALVTLPAYLAWRTAKQKMPPATEETATPAESIVRESEATDSDSAPDTPIPAPHMAADPTPSEEPLAPRRPRRRVHLDASEPAAPAPELSPPVGNPRRRRRVRLE